MSGSTRARLAAFVGGALFSAGVAAGQENAFGQHIIRTRPADSVATTGARTPGALVNSGVARTLTNTALAQGVIDITEPAPTEVEPGKVFLVDAIEILFEQLNESLLFFENLLRARAGLPPRIPTPPPTDDNGDDDPRGGRK